jgi:hypothetical protein
MAKQRRRVGGCWSRWRRREGSRVPLFIVHVTVQVRTKDREKAEELVDNWLGTITKNKQIKEPRQFEEIGIDYDATEEEDD